MKCPQCDYNGTKVLDSRPSDEARAIRRRRECESCGYRYTTFERVEKTPLMVVKKDGNREEFSYEKLLRGLVRACEKRPIPMETLENLTADTEKEMRSRGSSEVSSNDIGEYIMSNLADIDDVAYVRFASVYRQFKDINVFVDELKDLIDRENR
ncbi:transcriptional regulator NrdR [Alkalicoccus urumqiensis]|uniref:Transcriptional repressor NrdR n=1 Tax=Alkalicoccus urumqiensis TaxID=1548213 RepID=A0A2P6MDE8_ALKUR|nr:transcriptional regulator NrdR [Alkalicoccus urumqiensis]PRO64305.1 transcriptional regulator NrdR [Alkalicoccus urumqiensis]